jgi:hypothetical protein
MLLTQKRSLRLDYHNGISRSSRWARSVPGRSWRHPGIPTEWVKVLDRQPEPDIVTLPNHVWPDTRAKPPPVPAAWLEFREAAPDRANDSYDPSSWRGNRQLEAAWSHPRMSPRTSKALPTIEPVVPVLG